MTNIRLACRALARTPSFTLAALAALALGIGAATTVFSVADGVLFRPLPYDHPDRLVAVSAAIRARDLLRWSVPPEEFDAWRASSQSFETLTGYQPSGTFTVNLPDEPQEVAAFSVTPGFLRVLGVAPVLGRGFLDDEFLPGTSRAWLLTDGVWRRLFQADPSIVGRQLTVNDQPAHVIGVLPRTFAFPAASARRPPEVLQAFVRTPEAMRSRLSLIGRLAPGVHAERAQTELDAMAAARGAESGLRNTRIDGATVEPLDSALTRETQLVMLLLVGAVTTLLLIGCANVANLVLARGSDRRGELAVRAALGASRAALVRLVVTESAVLAVAGGAAGIVLAYWAVSLISPLVPDDLKLLKAIAIDARAVLFATGASAVCVLLCGLAPALRVAGADLAQVLNQSSSRATAGRLRGRQLIVAMEVALAVVLLVGGALTANAMIRLLRVDHGYNAERVLTMRVQLPRGRVYPPRSTVFVERVLSATRSVPGVLSAGGVEGTPLERTLYAGHYSVEGFSAEWLRANADFGGGACCTQTQWVSADYLAALGVPIIAGRSFTPADATAATRVALINERLARKFPSGVNPVGHRLVSGEDDRRVIVGVVADVRDMSLEYRPAQTIYLPLDERGASGLTLVVRTGVEPLSLAASLRQAIQQQAGPVLISNVQTLDDLLWRSVAQRRLHAYLFGAFGLVALLLAGIGIYSVIAYGVAQRTREIGVRLALGDSPAGVRRLIIAQSFVPVCAGLVAGLAAALGLSRFLATLLYEVQPRDMTTYAVVYVALCATALAAAYIPARRASRVDPIVALRAE